MSGRTILVNQVWEHWASKKRLQVVQVADEITVLHATNHEGTFHKTEHLTPEWILHHYLYIGELAT